MKRTNVLLWMIVILFVGFALWVISTGRWDSLAGSFIDGIWTRIENIVRSIFRQ